MVRPSRPVLAVALLALVAAALTGCGTPGYTAHERDQLIGRNWGYEFAQVTDDVDYLLLLRPASHLTVWNVQQGPGPF